MKYLCLVYVEEAKLEAMSKAEANACVEESLAYDRTLEASGHMVTAHALKSVATAASVKVRNGQTTITDGPFTETKEQLVGFILIEAKDREHALKAASGIPLAGLGTVEVRPIMEPAQEFPVQWRQA